MTSSSPLTVGGCPDLPKPDLSEPYSIVVVDDEKIIAESAAMILRWKGFNVQSFTNPFEALRSIHAKAPDLLLCDIVMPLLSGIELATRVHQECPGCKIVLVTGESDVDQTWETIKARGHDFDLVLKPLHPLELVLRVQMSLGVVT
jgi:DNA-binding NtrC family response regulator